jgi:nicotinate phosphoribosyltransferase
MAFDSELESFKAYAQAYPGDSIFLVDTYNTIDAIKKAIEIGLWLKTKNKKLLGIRLDSGDLAYLSIRARKMFDEAGLTDAKIYASNELDETVITELKRQNARIQVWGVGTNLVTAKDQPALDGVYKLSAIRDPDSPWTYKLKLSEQQFKISNPGILQVRRYFNDEGNIADMIYDINANVSHDAVMVDPFDATKEREIKKDWDCRDLLVPIYRGGECVYNLPSLIAIRQNTIQNLSQLQPSIKRFLNPHQYVVGMEKSLYRLKINLIKQIRSKFGTHYP